MARFAPPPTPTDAETAGPALIGLNGQGKKIIKYNNGIMKYFKRDITYSNISSKVKSQGNNLQTVKGNNIVTCAKSYLSSPAKGPEVIESLIVEALPVEQNGESEEGIRQAQLKY